jgi:hypothetical protein
MTIQQSRIGSQIYIGQAVWFQHHCFGSTMPIGQFIGNLSSSGLGSHAATAGLSPATELSMSGFTEWLVGRFHFVPSESAELDEIVLTILVVVDDHTIHWNAQVYFRCSASEGSTCTEDSELDFVIRLARKQWLLDETVVLCQLVSWLVVPAEKPHRLSCEWSSYHFNGLFNSPLHHF